MISGGSGTFRLISLNYSMLLYRGVQKVHVWFLGGIEIDPDIGMTECGDREYGCRVESNGDSPIQKEAAEVHAVARESENAFLYPVALNLSAPLISQST